MALASLSIRLSENILRLLDITFLLQRLLRMVQVFVGAQPEGSHGGATFNLNLPRAAADSVADAGVLRKEEGCRLLCHLDPARCAS